MTAAATHRPQDCAAHLLSPSEVDWLSQWLNKPLGCAYALSWLVSQGIGSNLGPNQLVSGCQVVRGLMFPWKINLRGLGAISTCTSVLLWNLD
jgi:hypothetical protein